MSISALAELHRAVGRPPLDKGAFSGEADLSQYRGLLIEISGSGSGSFVELVFEGDDYDDDPSSLPATGRVKFEVKPSRTSGSRFYQNIVDLIKGDPKIGRGEAPSDFYLIDENYLDGVEEKCERVENLKKVCCFIEKLSSLAHYHDEKTKSSFLRLVFIKAEEVGVSQALVIETRVDEDILALASDLNVGRIVALCDSDEINDAHYREKIAVFGNTVSEFIKGKPEGERSFNYLIRKWSDFFDDFDKNLAVYISGFAFHKAKREVAEAEVDISSKLSGILGDIAGKLLSIPVSFAAVALIPKSGDVLKSSIIVVGLIVASLIMSELIGNQRSRLRRVVHSKNMVLSSIEGKKDTYPDDLKEDVAKISRDLEEDEKRIKKLLDIYRRLCWLPAALALVVHVYFVLSGFPS